MRRGKAYVHRQNQSERDNCVEQVILASNGITTDADAAGELVKFRLAPFGTVFSALKAMLDYFGGHNVEAVAELLDTAGRFLYRLPESHSRMASMAEACLLPSF